MACSLPAGGESKIEGKSKLEFGRGRDTIAETLKPMIELKVHCDCGQKYKFDVEPVNGQMPFTVACPICQRDGTAKANALLQQMTVFKLVEPAPAAASAPIAPPPFVPPTAPPPAPSPTARLRVNLSAHAAVPAQPASAPPPIAPAMGVTLPPISGRLRTAASATAAEPGKQPSFGMGILGGFIGAVIGALIYFVIFKTTGVRTGMALVIGGLAGGGAYWLGKGEGSNELGGITVVFVIVGVLAAQYFVALGWWNRILDEGYTESVKEARVVVKAVPTGSDAEIRGYLARQSADEGEVVKPASVSDDEVKVFKEKELPRYQELASGKLTKEQYLAQFGHKLDKKSETEDADTFKGLFILLTINIRGVISLVIAGGLAYRLSTNA